MHCWAEWTVQLYKTRYSLHVFVCPEAIITLETSDDAEQSRNTCSPGFNHNTWGENQKKKQMIYKNQFIPCNNKETWGQIEGMKGQMRHKTKRSI